MNRTFKKALSVFLACVLLAVSMPVQSFAAFESIKAPEIQEIKIKDTSQPLSVKAVDGYVKDEIASFEEFFGNITEEELLSDYSSSLALDLQSLNYICYFKVTLASGETYDISNYDNFIEYNSIYEIEVDAYITYEDYLEAKEKGADEIKVTVSGEVYRNYFSYSLVNEYTTAQNLPLVDMIVKSITPLSELPEKYYADTWYYDMEGAEFLIEYADGTKVTAKAESESYKPYGCLEYGNYILDGKLLHSEFEENSEKKTAFFYIYYVDASYKKEVEYIDDSLFKGVEITDCVFDTDTARLSSISFNLTYNDGTVKAFTKEITAESEDLFDGVEIGLIDGCDVMVFVYWGNGVIYNTNYDADYYYIEIYVGENTDMVTVDNPSDKVPFDRGLDGSYFIHVLDIIKTVLYMMLRPLGVLLSVVGGSLYIFMY